MVIKDEKLAETLNSGIFIRINDMGHAILKKEDGSEVAVWDGRMRL